MTGNTLTNALTREYRYIGELPDGYEYKLVEQNGWLKIIGVSHDKGVIGFYIDSDFNLQKMEV